MTTTKPTCNDCWFRREGLCALPGDAPCPTFRAVVGNTRQPPRQPVLVLRPAAPLAAPLAAPIVTA